MTNQQVLVGFKLKIGRSQVEKQYVYYTEKNRCDVKHFDWFLQEAGL